jgi:phage head maturation protease
VVSRVSRGDISGSSFWFSVDGPDDEEWTAPMTRAGLPLRTLKRLRLVDVSVVTFPAYHETTSFVVRDASAADVARRQALRAMIDRAKAVTS